MWFKGKQNPEIWVQFVSLQAAVILTKLSRIDLVPYYYKDSFDLVSFQVTKRIRNESTLLFLVLKK